MPDLTPGGPDPSADLAKSSGPQISDAHAPPAANPHVVGSTGKPFPLPPEPLISSGMAGAGPKANIEYPTESIRSVEIESALGSGQVTEAAGVSPPKAPRINKDDAIIGTVVAGRYRVEARLGEGGMGSVYLVEHTHMRKRLALKVLHRDLSGSEEMVARFEREAMAAAHIDHPNVAGATDFGKLEDGSFYLVLEYVEGKSLRSVIEKGPIAPRRAVAIAAQILSAIRRAHDLGIVHRDLKPENILLVSRDLTREGRDGLPQDDDAEFVKVLDFGIARVPIGSLSGTSSGSGRPSDHGPSLTRAGMVYGTPEYMSPEQALGATVDGRSDQYAMGVMLFEMLTGTRPYDNKDKVALLGQHVAGPIPMLRARAVKLDLPATLEAVVTRMMAKSASDRYDDAASASEALSTALAEAHVHPSSTKLVAASGANPALVISSIGPSGQVAVVSALTDVSASQPDVIDRKSAQLQSGSPLANSRRLVVILATAAAALVVLVFVLVGGRKPTEDDKRPTRSKDGAEISTSRSAGNPSVLVSSDPAPSKSAAVADDKLAKDQALSLLGRVIANEENALTELEQLEAKNPTNIDVRKALMNAYAKTKRLPDALRVMKKLVTESPAAALDPALPPLLEEAMASASPTTVDTGFFLLSGPLGPEGARILYDVAYGAKGSAALRNRATKALADPEVQRVMAGPIRAIVEIRATNVCSIRKNILEAHRSELDFRALAVVKPMQKTSGCGGFFKTSDCYPCMREGKYLETLVKELEDRVKTDPGKASPSASSSDGRK